MWLWCSKGDFHFLHSFYILKLEFFSEIELSLLPYLFIYINMKKWILILFYGLSYLFFCSYCSSFGHQQFFQVGTCILPIYLFLRLPYFLASQSAPNSFYTFPAPAMEATTSPRSLGSLYWRSLILSRMYINVNRIPALQWITLLNSWLHEHVILDSTILQHWLHDGNCFFFFLV